MSRLTDFIDSLPEDQRPLVSAYVDAMANGLIDKVEEAVDMLIIGSPADAYTTMIEGLPTSSLLTALETVNKQLLSLNKKAMVAREFQHEFWYQLILISFAFFRKEIADSISND